MYTMYLFNQLTVNSQNCRRWRQNFADPQLQVDEKLVRGRQQF